MKEAEIMKNNLNIPAPEDTKGRMKFWLEHVAYQFAEAKKTNDTGALKELTVRWHEISCLAGFLRLLTSQEIKAIEIEAISNV